MDVKDQGAQMEPLLPPVRRHVHTSCASYLRFHRAQRHPTVIIILILTLLLITRGLLLYLICIALTKSLEQKYAFQSSVFISLLTH